MDKSYEVTPKIATKQSPKKYILGSNITMCAALEHCFEAVGRYAPIDIQDINISIGKENLGLQQWLKL
jgi:hypothetical protein